MLNSKDLIDIFKKKKINFFTGVPDSLLKNFLYFLSREKKITNLTAVNEGSAIAIATGNYLVSKKIPLVYLQNSGLGNAINPLVSIADKKVYSIPMVLLIGWRGSPNSSDEPQHMTKGGITRKLLSNLKIKNMILKSKKDLKRIPQIIDYSKKKSVPVAILVEKNLFEKEKKSEEKRFKYSIKRSSFILLLLKNIGQKDKIISTTGYTSRELSQLRTHNKIKKGKDFYMVGGMGHATSVALGCSISNKSKIFCLDGDGSFLMHMGSITTVANYGGKNFKYILLNNNSHESVGGQNTNSEKINFEKFSKSIGYKNFFLINSQKKMKNIFLKFVKKDGPNFLEVRIKNESMNNLKRPKNFVQIKKSFMR